MGWKEHPPVTWIKHKMNSSQNERKIISNLFSFSVSKHKAFVVSQLQDLQTKMKYSYNQCAEILQHTIN